MGSSTLVPPVPIFPGVPESPSFPAATCSVGLTPTLSAGKPMFSLRVLLTKGTAVWFNKDGFASLTENAGGDITWGTSFLIGTAFSPSPTRWSGFVGAPAGDFSMGLRVFLEQYTISLNSGGHFTSIHGFLGKRRFDSSPKLFLDDLTERKILIKFQFRNDKYLMLNADFKTLV